MKKVIMSLFAITAIFISHNSLAGEPPYKNVWDDQELKEKLRTLELDRDAKLSELDSLGKQLDERRNKDNKDEHASEDIQRLSFQRDRALAELGEINRQASDIRLALSDQRQIALRERLKGLSKALDPIIVTPDKVFIAKPESLRNQVLVLTSGLDSALAEAHEINKQNSELAALRSLRAQISISGAAMVLNYQIGKYQGKIPELSTPELLAASAKLEGFAKLSPYYKKPEIYKAPQRNIVIPIPAQHGPKY